jgi:hypothetical protein
VGEERSAIAETVEGFDVSWKGIVCLQIMLDVDLRFIVPFHFSSLGDFASGSPQYT